MTRNTNARIAGVTFLLYIAAGLGSMALSRRVTGGANVAERLARIAEHETGVGVLVMLGFVQAFSAIVLGVTLWAITRAQDEDLAMLGLASRVGEGVIGGLSIPGTLALLSLATSMGTDAAAGAAANALGAYLFRSDVGVPGTFFAVGSTCFAWLLLRGRTIPGALAWLGVVASVILVAGLPLQLAGFLRGPVAMAMWLPMLAFEVPLALWLIVRGVAPPAVKPAGDHPRIGTQ